MTDLITRLGYLCMGSRLKRLGERMQAAVTLVLEARGVAVQPGQMALLAALGERDGLPVGALGEVVGISQPGVTRALARLEHLGLVTPAAGTEDRRQRVMALTPEGRVLLDDLQQSLFPAIERAVAELCAAAEGDLLQAVGGVEAGLDREPLDRRISAMQAGA